MPKNTIKNHLGGRPLGSSHYLRQGGGANRGGGKNFSASKLRGGKILVHRHLRALLKHLENTLKFFCRYAANTTQCNTTNFINVPTVKGHFHVLGRCVRHVLLSYLLMNLHVNVLRLKVRGGKSLVRAIFGFALPHPLP